MTVFTRDIKVKVNEEFGEKTVRAIATMKNVTAEGKKPGRFKIEVVVSKEDFQILKIENVLIDGLFFDCQRVQPKLKELCGLTITRGYNKKIKEIAGGCEGCTHIVELLTEVGRCVYQAHHGRLLVKEGMDACVESYRKLSKVNCSGVDNYEGQGM